MLVVRHCQSGSYTSKMNKHGISTLLVTIYACLLLFVDIFVFDCSCVCVPLCTCLYSSVYLCFYIEVPSNPLRNQHGRSMDLTSYELLTDPAIKASASVSTAPAQSRIFQMWIECQLRGMLDTCILFHYNLLSVKRLLDKNCLLSFSLEFGRRWACARSVPLTSGNPT